MENYLVRAMEVSRLSPTQLDKLHRFEKSIQSLRGLDQRTNTYQTIVNREPRCLYPQEIQGGFGLGPLKEHYGIPADNDTAQSAHAQRLRGEFRAAGLMPVRGDINLCNIEEVHLFDESIRSCASINFHFDLATVGKKSRRLSDEV